MIVAISFLLWVIVAVVANSPLGDMFIISQMISILPNFLVAIIVPFGVIAIIRLLTKTWKEFRIFYYILFATLVISIIYEYVQTSYYGASFDVYDIIASGIGIFSDMVLYDRFETEALKKYKVLKDADKGKTK